MDNILLNTDSYKMTHWKQYPPGSEYVYSYFESRGGMFNELIFFGLEYIIKKYLQGFVISKNKIEEAAALCDEHIGPGIFNIAGWNYINDMYGGRLPLEIYALPEGTVFNPREVAMTVVNTDPLVPWLTNYVESILTHIWSPITVASYSRQMREMLENYKEVTGGEEAVDFKLHDFGFRGASSVETAALAGAAHLISFKGTDTLPAIKLINNYYNDVGDMPGFSIPASEHSTITSWGRDKELEAFANMLKQYPIGLVACVSDSFDIFKACEHLWGVELKDKILERDGVLIVRPDSGDPKEIVIQVLKILAKAFGYSINNKGFKTLNPKIRVIQGDGVNLNTMEDILDKMAEFKWSIDNIAFGSGGALLQMHNRDDAKFAFKASAICVNGIWRDIYKDPVTDSGKRSKRGRFSPKDKKLQLKFRNGDIYNTTQSFDIIRKRAYGA